MPLQAEVKRKYKNNDDKYYTKSVNDSSKKSTKQLPKKSKVTKPSQQKKPANAYTDTATKAAQTIKNNVEGKKGGLKKSSVSTSGYVQKTTKANNVAKTIAQRQWDNEKGHSYKTDSKENIGRTGANVKKRTVKQWASDINESTSKKTHPYEGLSYDKISSHKQGGHQSDKSAEKSNKNLQKNERHQAYTNPQFREIGQEAASSYAIPKFFGNMAEATMNYLSPVGLVATAVTGSTPSEWDFFKPHNYTKADEYRNNQFHSGRAAMAGQLVGGALGFNAGRGLGYMKAFNNYADTIMNSTKLGSMIKNSSVVGKIGSKLGTEAVDNFLREGVAEGLRDMTLGVGENAIISYGEGNKGMDWLTDTALQTGADIGLGSLLNGVGLGNQLRKVNKLLDRTPTDLLRGSKSKTEYMTKLVKEAEANLERMDIEGVSRDVRNAHLNKASELMTELENVRGLDEKSFKTYSKSKEIPDLTKIGEAASDSAGNTVEEAVENANTKAETSLKKRNATRGKSVESAIEESKTERAERKAKEDKIREENPDKYTTTRRALKKEPETTTITVGGESVQTKATTEAKPTPTEVKPTKAEPQKVKAEEPTVNKTPETVEAKAETSKEPPKERERSKANLLAYEPNKASIINKMQEAGVELPDNYLDLTAKELRALNDGTLSLEDARKIKRKRGRSATKKKQINLDEYDKISNQTGKPDSKIKSELIEKYTANKAELGEALSEAEIKELNGKNLDEVRGVIDNDAVTRGGYKDLDEYYDDTLFRSENSKPELERKNEAEAGTLRSEQTRKGIDDSYTKADETPSALPKKIADDMDGFIERSIGMDVHPGLKPLSNRFSTDDFKVTEDAVREFIEKSNKYTLVDGKVHLKDAPDPYTTTTASGGIATKTSTANIKGKGLPKKLEKSDRAKITRENQFNLSQKIDASRETNKAKWNLPELQKKKYAALDEKVVTNNKTGSSKKKSKKLNFEGVENGREVKIADNPKKTLSEKVSFYARKFREQFITNIAEAERVDRKRGDAKLQEKISGYNSSKARSIYQLKTGITDMKGNAILDSDGKELRAFFDTLNYKDEGVLNTYLQHRFNIELAKSGGDGMFTKDRWGFNSESAQGYVDRIIETYPKMASSSDKIKSWLLNGMRDDDTYKSLKKKYGGSIDKIVKEIGEAKSKASKDLVEELERDFPQLAEIGKEWDNNWNAFMNAYAVDGGLISKEAMANMYKHYFPGIRAREASSGMNSLDTPDVIKKIKGGNETAMLTAKDQAAVMTNRVVSAAYRNQVGLQLLEDIRSGEMEGLGHIIDNTGESVKDLDDAVITMANTVEDIINGGTRLTVLENGNKVTIELSDEMATMLKTLYYAKDVNIASKVGKAITNPIKFGITTASMTFTPANMLRDMATALIQSEHSMGKTITGWGKAIAGMTGVNKKYAKLYKQYIFGAGKNIDNYVQGNGFDTSSILEPKGIKALKQKIINGLTFFGEKGETIPRFGEFLNTMEKTGGDLEKAVRDSKEVTVDFSRKGSGEFIETMNSWVMYLNAGIEGLDKFARTLKAHPVRTMGRATVVIGVPYTLCTVLNYDNPNFWDLSDRTRQQYFCVPNFYGDKDEDGNCKTFFRIPATREYGSALLASFDVALRYARGEKDAGSGFIQTIKEGFLPNDAMTNNILAPIVSNIPSNKDYKGDKILTSAEEKNLKLGKYLDKQYNANTSGAALAISKVTNSVVGDTDIPILKYLKSPKLVDYLIDSYGGYYGDVIQGATSQSNTTAIEALRSAALQPFENKFTADERYSSKALNNAFDYYDELSADSNNMELDANGTSEAKVKYYAAKKIMDSIYESIDVEKQIKVDSSLSRSEKDSQIKELREARIELAKSLESEVNKAVQEYKEAPTYTSLTDSAKEKWNENLGMKKEEWAKVYKLNLEEYDKAVENTGYGTSADEKRMLLLDNGVTTYAQAQSILGEKTSKDKWDEAVDAHKNGQSYAGLVKANQEKRERQENMTQQEINFDNYGKQRYETRHNETKNKPIDQKLYDAGLYEALYVDKHTNNNGSITQPEAMNVIENLDKMYGLTREQKAYYWYLFSPEKGWSRKPYGEWKG